MNTLPQLYAVYGELMIQQKVLTARIDQVEQAIQHELNQPRGAAPAEAASEKENNK